MNAVIEIADEPQPLEAGGGYPWSVLFESGREVLGVAFSRVTAAVEIGNALQYEQISRSGAAQ